MTDPVADPVPAKKRPQMKIIGKCACPACDVEVPFKEQANGYAAISCNWCGFQSYARNEDADAHMRSKWLKPKKAEPAPAKPDKPDEKPVAPEKKKTLMQRL